MWLKFNNVLTGNWQDSVIPMFLLWVKEMLPRPYDIKWFFIMGGYLSKEKLPIPAGKFNGGQKMWFWLVTVKTILKEVFLAYKFVFLEYEVFYLAIFNYTFYQIINMGKQEEE